MAAAGARWLLAALLFAGIAAALSAGLVGGKGRRGGGAFLSARGSFMMSSNRAGNSEELELLGDSSSSSSSGMLGISSQDQQLGWKNSDQLPDTNDLGEQEGDAVRELGKSTMSFRRRRRRKKKFFRRRRKKKAPEAAQGAVTAAVARAECESACKLLFPHSYNKVDKRSSLPAWAGVSPQCLGTIEGPTFRMSRKADTAKRDLCKRACDSHYNGNVLTWKLGTNYLPSCQDGSIDCGYCQGAHIHLQRGPMSEEKWWAREGKAGKEKTTKLGKWVFMASANVRSIESSMVDAVMLSERAFPWGYTHGGAIRADYDSCKEKCKKSSKDQDCSTCEVGGEEYSRIMNKRCERYHDLHPAKSCLNELPWAFYKVTAKVLKVQECYTPKEGYTRLCNLCARYRSFTNATQELVAYQKSFLKEFPRLKESCGLGASKVDACGCNLSQEGWSRRRKAGSHCKKGSTTNAAEASDCLKKSAAESAKCVSDVDLPNFVKCDSSKRCTTVEVCFLGESYAQTRSPDLLLRKTESNIVRKPPKPICWRPAEGTQPPPGFIQKSWFKNRQEYERLLMPNSWGLSACGMA